VPTDELVTDILIKPLSGWKFQYLLFKLLGWNIEVNNKCDFNEEVCSNLYRMCSLSCDREKGLF
jgi:hypothetical protein